MRSGPNRNDGPGTPRREARPSDKDKAEEAEEAEQTEVEEKAPEKNRLQSQLGNQAILSMLAGRGGIGEAGLDGDGGAEYIARDQEEESRFDHGGIDDVDDPPEVVIADLTRSWRPQHSPNTDRPAFLEPMPDDDLPPEDEGWLDAVFAGPLPALPAAWTSDALIQPSEGVLAGSLAAWSQSVTWWTGPSQLDRVLARIVTHPPPQLQDRAARVTLGRARTATLGVAALLRSPTLSGRSDASTAAFVDFCLEVAGRTLRARAIHRPPEPVEGQPARIPRALEAAGELLARWPGRARPSPLDEPATMAWNVHADRLLEYADPLALVPALERPPAPTFDPDDPLGLDRVLVALTGAEPDPLAELSEAAIASAERIAHAGISTRMGLAGTALVVADVSALWSSGAPGDSLRGLLEAADAQVDSLLQLLAEIARAARRRSVPPDGLRSGLRRAARQLRRLQREARQALGELVAGLLPGEPQVILPAEGPEDALAEALADGDPSRLVDVAVHGGDPLEDRVTRALLTLAAGRARADDLLELRRDCLSARRELLADVVGTCAGPLLLGSRRFDDAIALADARWRAALTRRNGVSAAEAALLGIEADARRGRLDRAEARRLDAGRALHAMGAGGGLTLLARWALPEDD